MIIYDIIKWISIVKRSTTLYVSYVVHDCIMQHVNVNDSDTGVFPANNV